MSLPAKAQDSSLGITFYGSFLHSSKVPNALFFFSKIEKNDSFELRKALRSHKIDVLVLSSRGGSVFEGLNMAGIIYDKKLTTYVPKQGIDGKGNCASACAFMFFGGSTRVADGKLGVHQFYSGQANESAEIGATQENAQFTVSEIIGFLNEFETPPFVYERMFQQTEMYYFNIDELSRIKRANRIISSTEIASISKFISDFNVKLSTYDEKKKTKVTVSIPEKPKVIPKKVETYPKPMDEKLLVKNIQLELNRLKCAAGTADGVIGAKTRAALDRFNKVTGKKIDYSALNDPLLLKQLAQYAPIKKCYVKQKQNKKNPDWSRYRTAYLNNLKAGSLGWITAWNVTGKCNWGQVNEKWYSWKRMYWHYIASPNLAGDERGTFSLVPKKNGGKSSANLFGKGDMKITRLNWDEFRASGSGCTKIVGKIIRQ